MRLQNLHGMARLGMSICHAAAQSFRLLSSLPGPIFCLDMDAYGIFKARRHCSALNPYIRLSVNDVALVAARDRRHTCSHTSRYVPYCKSNYLFIDIKYVRLHILHVKISQRYALVDPVTVASAQCPPS